MQQQQADSVVNSLEKHGYWYGHQSSLISYIRQLGTPTKIAQDDGGSQTGGPNTTHIHYGEDIILEIYDDGSYSGLVTRKDEQGAYQLRFTHPEDQVVCVIEKYTTTTDKTIYSLKVTSNKEEYPSGETQNAKIASYATRFRAAKAQTPVIVSM